MKTTVIDLESLPIGGGAPLFQGDDHGGIGISFFVSIPAPGRGPGLHRHPYPEVFVVVDGRARFTVGEETLDAEAGQIVIGPAGVPHRFENPTNERTRLVTLHPRGHVETEWLTDVTA